MMKLTASNAIPQYTAASSLTFSASQLESVETDQFVRFGSGDDFDTAPFAQYTTLYRKYKEAWREAQEKPGRLKAAFLAEQYPGMEDDIKIYGQKFVDAKVNRLMDSFKLPGDIYDESSRAQEASEAYAKEHCFDAELLTPLFAMGLTGAVTNICELLFANETPLPEQAKKAVYQRLETDKDVFSAVLKNVANWRVGSGKPADRLLIKIPYEQLLEILEAHTGVKWPQEGEQAYEQIGKIVAPTSQVSHHVTNMLQKAGLIQDARSQNAQWKGRFAWVEGESPEDQED